MAWVYLVIAGIFEVGFATSLKLSENFSNWPYTIGFFVCAAISFGLLVVAVKHIPLGTAYAVWTGIGAFGTALVGILFFGDPATVGRIVFLVLLIGSVIGLKLVSPDDSKPAQVKEVS
ncbi:multidrug efflux SMR transporter [Meiothermus sp. CFH 77666]|uniref:DMT family transporter n=1 Tax=Meiothermus sp. CFH 77666 TaxID=2817942 RepID=UPI001AA06274|nr:multidrug efflux SMR transporter [Meiothermus sp. CFH 77666]MBO1436791.1 multidrug efflux SMR transporter [Meiothermus sp. CFH 77666]